MVRIAYAAALIVAAALVTIVNPADAQSRRVQVGTLACSLSSSVGLIVGSQRNVNCDFSSSGAPVEHYTGTMTRIGLDIGVTTGGAIIWQVFADTDRYAAGMLTGTYAGASGEVSIAAGLGANVLVGGSHSTVALQPISVQGQTGLNIAAGVGALELHPLR
jgi:hypothetical protein